MTAATVKESTIPTGNLKQVPIKDIKIPARFRIDYGDMDSFVESIREKGILQPITLTQDLTLLAGGRRLRAATILNLDKIPALVRKLTDSVDAVEIELIENTQRKDFTWQENIAIIARIDMLYKEKNYDWSGRKTAVLLDKNAMDISRALQLSNAIKIIPELAEQSTASDAFKMLKRFEEDAIIGVLRERQEQELVLASGETSDPSDPSDPNSLNQPERTTNWNYKPDLVTRLQIAKANYRIGDTFDGLAELKTDGMIHLIECDPPYGIELNDVKSGSDRVNSTVTGYNEVPMDKYEAWLNKLAPELFRVAGKDCWLIFWFGPTWHTQVKNALTSAGWHVDDIPAIWVKERGQTLQPEIYLARGYEPFFLCRKGQPYMAKRGRLNVFNFPGIPGTQKYHPTERPLPLIEDILSTLGMSKQVVLVPFLGSGATLRACYKLGMSAFGFDNDPKYKDRFMLAVEEDFKLLEQQQGTEK